MTDCERNHGPGIEPSAAGKPWTASQCGLCYRALNPVTGAVLLPEMRERKGIVAEPPCRHLGAATGASVSCPSCRGHVELKLFGCAVHGDCTLGKPAAGHGCCVGCPDKSARAGTAQLVVSADGIGDHLLALTVAEGWRAANPGRELILAVRHRQWVDLFEGGQLAHAPIAGAESVYPELERRGPLHFVEAATKIPARSLPRAKPLPADAASWAEQYRGCVVLAPLTLGNGATSRNWLLSHWHRLEQLLAERGKECAIIGAGGETRLSGFGTPPILGEPAVRVVALMRVSSCAVSNESGMAHLAGALGVPCAVLAAQLDGKAIHGIWPRSFVLQGPLGCSKCHWSGPHWRPACDSVCASLNAIQPEAVLSAIAPWLDGPEEPYLSDPLANAELCGKLDKLLCRDAEGKMPPHGDRRKSMGLAMRSLTGRTSPLIVETGCQRADEDWSAGMSTQTFGFWCKHMGGRLVSVDNDSGHVAFARQRAKGLPVEVVEADSTVWLRAYCGQPIDLLYLDALDTYLPGHAEHCLAEAQFGANRMTWEGSILIDDTFLERGKLTGKGRLAVPWLCERGWRIKHMGYQALLCRC